MNYFISREGEQYGPYTLADLQRYAASGEVLLTDMATGEGLDEPVSVAQSSAPSPFHRHSRREPTPQRSTSIQTLPIFTGAWSLHLASLAAESSVLSGT